MDMGLIPSFMLYVIIYAGTLRLFLIKEFSLKVNVNV
jgi:hypothetical protein